MPRYRYELHPVDDTGESLTIEENPPGSDAYEQAKGMAQQQIGAGAFGVGILDTETQQIDLGFGLGVPYPDDLCPNN